MPRTLWRGSTLLLRFWGNRRAVCWRTEQRWLIRGFLLGIWVEVSKSSRNPARNNWRPLIKKRDD